jgi:purine-binding chemotaxis protein CheW
MSTTRATEPGDTSQAPERLEVLVFEVGGQRYGVPASAVREIVRAVTIVPLPRAPAVIEGIINVRGSIVPVLDVRLRFRLPATPLRHTDHLIVARAGARQVALHVDRAIGLVRLEPAAIEEAKGAVPGVEYVAWVAKLPDDLVLVHDLETFLSRAEAETLDAALTPAAEPSGEGGVR